MSDFKQGLYETEVDYLARLHRLKHSESIRWEDMTEAYNRENGTKISADTLRFRCKRAANQQLINDLPEYLQDDLPSKDEGQDPEAVKLERRRELAKLKVQLHDERTQINALVRQMAREETFKEIAETLLDRMNLQNPLTPIDSVVADSDTQGLLLLSDWHFGIEFTNNRNSYSPDISKKRISRLLNEVIKYCKKDNINKVTIFNLGDLISGRIHSQIRIQNRFDIMEQTINICLILESFIKSLAEAHIAVDYYDCLDNHSRVEADKRESLASESMTEIIHFYLSRRFEDFKNINIIENPFGREIITCKIFNYNICGIHGHQDKNISKAISNLTLYCHEFFDLVCSAHKHHFSSDELNCCLSIMNSSVMGTDDYAESLRYSAQPSQTFITVAEDNLLQDVRRIVL